MVCETPKSPATLKYKIYAFYVGCTYQSTKVKKSAVSISDPREYTLIVDTIIIVHKIVAVIARAVSEG